MTPKPRRGHPVPIGDYFYPTREDSEPDVEAFEDEVLAEDPVLDALAKLQPEVGERFNTRNKFISRFPYLAPRTKMEMTVLSAGLAPYISRVYEDVAEGVEKKNLSLGEEEETLDANEEALFVIAGIIVAVRDLKADALNNVEALGELIRRNSGAYPTPGQVINDRPARDALAGYMAARHWLNKGSWQPRQYKGEPNQRREETIEKMRGALRVSAPENVSRLFERVFVSETYRFRYLNQELDSIKNHPLNLDAEEAALKEMIRLQEADAEAYVREFETE